MCRAVMEETLPAVGRGQARCQKAQQRAARRIVRKYRRREERKEIEKLRRLLPAGASQLRRQEVIDHTIELIVSLEQQLLAKILADGRVPGLLAHTGLAALQQDQLSLESLRTAMSPISPPRLPAPQFPRFASRPRYGNERK